MGQVFLGKWWHWLILVVAIGLLWKVGNTKLHVIEFNTFIMLLLAGTVASLLLIIFGTRRGVQVTRDPLDEVDEDPPMPTAD